MSPRCPDHNAADPRQRGLGHKRGCARLVSLPWSCRGGARSCIVRQTIVLKCGNLCWLCVVGRPCIVRSCIEYPLYCSAPCTY